MEFSEKNLMKVNFSPKLTILIIEVRQLLSMGYRVPHLIEETINHAKKFLKYSKMLEQVTYWKFLDKMHDKLFNYLLIKYFHKMFIYSTSFDVTISLFHCCSLLPKNTDTPILV